VLAFPDDIPWQPTSGNAFAARVLRQIFPIPEDVYRLCADYYLSNLPPLFGPVVALEAVGGYYRVHGANSHYGADLDLDRTRQIITWTYHTHRHLKRSADVLGLSGFPADEAEVLAVTFLAHRMISLKLDPERHPLKQDRLAALAGRGIRAALGHFDVAWLKRGAWALWFVAVLVSPTPVAKWLARAFFHPEARRGLTRRLSAPNLGAFRGHFKDQGPAP
jgi:hypothetical protein